MSGTKIEVGSVVRLNSDDDKSAKMTVASIADQTARVVWRTKDGKMHREPVPLAGLRLVRDSEDEGIPPG